MPNYIIFDIIDNVKGVRKAPRKGEKKMEENKTVANVGEIFAEKLKEVQERLDKERLEKGYCVYTAFLKFTDNEVEQMPESYSMPFAMRGQSPCAYVKKYIKDSVDEMTASVMYEVCYCFNGHDIAVTAETVAKAKKKFIIALWLEVSKKHE